MTVTRLKTAPKLRVVGKEPTERIYGSSAFIRRTRIRALVAGWPFRHATRVKDDDVWL
jgi:hypothetical protein